MTPTTEGFYWALFVPTNEWLVAEVVSLEDKDDLIVWVPGNETDWDLSDFRWGPPVLQPAELT